MEGLSCSRTSLTKRSQGAEPSRNTSAGDRNQTLIDFHAVVEKSIVANLLTKLVLHGSNSEQTQYQQLFLPSLNFLELRNGKARRVEDVLELVRRHRMQLAALVIDDVTIKPLKVLPNQSISAEGGWRAFVTALLDDSVLRCLYLDRLRYVFLDEVTSETKTWVVGTLISKRKSGDLVCGLPECNICDDGAHGAWGIRSEKFEAIERDGIRAGIELWLQKAKGRSEYKKSFRRQVADREMYAKCRCGARLLHGLLPADMEREMDWWRYDCNKARPGRARSSESTNLTAGAKDKSYGFRSGPSLVHHSW